MKKYTPIKILLFSLSLLILHFISCLDPVNHENLDLKPYVEFEGYINNENNQGSLLCEKGMIFSSGKTQLNKPFFLYIKPNSNLSLCYQWYKNDTIITQETDDTLYFDALSNNNSGTYFCEVKYNSLLERSLYYKIEIENNPPEFKDSLPLDSYQINEGDTLTIPFEAIDKNYDGITYTLTDNTLPEPETAVFDTVSKTLTWISEKGDQGIYKIVIEASDGKSTTEKVVDIGIGKVNYNPRISIANFNQDDTVSISENETLQFTAVISDPNTEDKPVFTEPENIPEGAVFDTSTGNFTYTPSYDVSSENSDKIFYSVTLNATDNASENPLQTQFIIHIVVRDKKFLITAESNTSEGIDPYGTIKAEPGSNFTFTITPKNDFKINKVLVNGKDEGVINSYTFQNIQQDHTIRVLFDRVIYTLNIISDENGSGQPEGTIQVDPDSSTIVTVKPKTGYGFDTWEIVQGNPEIIKISYEAFEVRIKNEPTTIKALFYEKGKIKCIATGQYYSHFLKTDNTLWATGSNKDGQLGDGTTTDRNYPVQVFTDVDTVISSLWSTFAIRKDKTIWVTGRNQYGQFGLGDTLNRKSFTQIPGINNIKGIAFGPYHTIIIKSDGTLWGAGWNNDNMLGFNDDVVSLYEFTEIPEISNIKKVVAGIYHTVALREDNAVLVVGHNYYGQLGLGNNDEPGRFTKMPGMDNVLDIACGAWRTYIVKSDNSLWATGWNHKGELGDGTKIDKNSPVHIINDAKTISTIRGNTLILKTDNTLWAVGYNTHGQFGIGSTKNSLTPVKVLDNVISAKAGELHTILLKNDNTVWGAGLNTNGQLGLGDNKRRLSFTEILF